MNQYGKMSPDQKAHFYARQKEYRKRNKSMCLVIRPEAYETIKAHAKSTGLSVTRFMVHSALTMCDFIDNGVMTDVHDQD